MDPIPTATTITFAYVFTFIFALGLYHAILLLVALAAKVQVIWGDLMRTMDLRR